MLKSLEAAGSRVLPDVASHGALAMLEVHPPHRQRVADLHQSFTDLIGARDDTAIVA